MSHTLTHVYAPNPGGVSEYVNVCLSQSGGAFDKEPLSRNSDISIPFPDETILHYSGYGFTKRGAPIWLLERFKAERARIKTFGIFFHELYAFGPPWSSAFWLSPLQRHIARQLAELSDFWITNREGSAQWIRRFAGDKPHAVLPVFSNVGEMAEYSQIRAPKLVVFGGVALRTATYRAAGDTLFNWARRQNLAIHDIGPGIKDLALAASLRGEGVIQHGRLDPREISKLLADAAFGVIAYPADFVAKSGVFAAYCAHGLCPVLFSKNCGPADGLVVAKHYISGLHGTTLDGMDTKSVGEAAWSWYQSHGVTKHVSTIQRLLHEKQHGPAQ